MLGESARASGPRISIVIITHNRAGQLRDCLETALTQDCGPETLEVVVVDDGSTDHTRQVVRRWHPFKVPVRYVYQRRRGIPAARNTGVRAARGAIVAIVADDYLLPPNYARTVAQFFDATPDANAVRFNMTTADSDLCARVCHLYFDVSVRNALAPTPRAGGHGLGAKLRKAFRKLPPPGNLVRSNHGLDAAGGAAFRREVFDAVGYFDQRLARSEDSEFSRRMRKLGLAIHYHPGATIKRRYGSSFAGAFWAHARAGYYWCQYKRLVDKRRLNVWNQVLRQTLELAILPIWRARHAPSLAKCLLYLPFLYWLELANKIGFVWFLVRGANGMREGSMTGAAAASPQTGASVLRQTGARSIELQRETWQSDGPGWRSSPRKSGR